jgi:chemotaxis protein methyltransferase CheR
MKPGSFDTLSRLLYVGSGLVIGPDKLYLLENRLGPVMKRLGITDLDALAGRIRLPTIGSPGGKLEQEVIEAMTTNESFFFRDEKPFTHFKNHALPRLTSTRPASAKLRIWSAAASTGQEAYSLAMILSENKAMLGNRTVEIIGTDIAREPLARATEGLYTQFEVQRGLPIQNLVKYFQKDGANWRVSDAIRAMAQFRVWNLLADLRSLGQFDIVFCRNVLIYFDQPTKSRVLESIAKQMPNDGILYLGGAETVLGITTAFTGQAGERGVYERAGMPTKQSNAASMLQSMS